MIPWAFAIGPSVTCMFVVGTSVRNLLRIRGWNFEERGLVEGGPAVLVVSPLAVTSQPRV
jgi:hypothetical protein